MTSRESNQTVYRTRRWRLTILLVGAGGLLFQLDFSVEFAAGVAAMSAAYELDRVR